jgi:MFS family permease
MPANWGAQPWAIWTDRWAVFPAEQWSRRWAAVPLWMGLEGAGARCCGACWGAAVLLPLYGVAERVETLLLVRSMHGLTGHCSCPALFAAAGEYAGIERARMMGRLGAAIAVVAIVAPPIGGALYRIGGATLCFVGLGGIMAVAALIAWRYVPETVRSSGASLPRPWQVLRVRSLVGGVSADAGLHPVCGDLSVSVPVAGRRMGWYDRNGGCTTGMDGAGGSSGYGAAARSFAATDVRRTAVGGGRSGSIGGGCWGSAQRARPRLVRDWIRRPVPSTTSANL